MANLKGCPFCGSDEISAWYKGVRYGRIAYVECDVCGAKSKAFSYYSRDEEFDEKDRGVIRAVDAWNRRAE